MFFASRCCGKDLRAELFSDLNGGVTHPAGGADVIFDPVGGDTFDEAMRCLNWGARIVVIGFAGGQPAWARTNHLLIKGASVTGIRAGEFGRRNPQCAHRNLETLLDWAARGDIWTHISHRFPLAGLEDAFQAIADRQIIGKAVLTRAY